MTAGQGETTVEGRRDGGPRFFPHREWDQIDAEAAE